MFGQNQTWASWFVPTCFRLSWSWTKCSIPNQLQETFHKRVSTWQTSYCISGEVDYEIFKKLSSCMAVDNQNKNTKRKCFSSQGDNYLPFVICSFYFLVIICTLIWENNICISITKLALNQNLHNNLKLFNPIRLGIWDLWVTRGGWIPSPLLKTHFGVSDPNSFLHSKWYIYKELRSKRILI